MDLTLVSEELKSKAVSEGLCNQWTSEWNNETIDSLCDKYIKGIDFCIEHDYPSNEYIKKNFDGVMQKHGIYVDDIFDKENIKKCVVNGMSAGKLIYDKFNIGRIYLRHNSFLSISAKDSSKIFISVYDNSNLEITECSDYAKIYISKYGGNIKFNTNNKNIIIK